MWLGSVARRGDSARSLVLIDMGAEPSEGTAETTETPQAAVDPTTPNGPAPSLKETLKSAQATDELEERRKAPEAIGDLGMHLRVA